MQSFEDRIREQEACIRRFDPRPPEEVLQERAMPKPLWARRQFSDTGQAQEPAVLKAAAESPANVFCIYTHVPYCRTRCGYCDCYSFPLTPSRKKELAVYPDLLEKEISWWGRNVSELFEKGLSTVHFGGGTPLMIGADGLLRTVETISKYFNLNKNTELALESTSSDINEKILDSLKRVGFTRLHIGVQSLQDPIRKAIGRKESGKQVLEKIRYAVGSGWIVSTDIIIGLPGYTESDILTDIEEMSAAGIEGLSIYELVRSPRNRAFFEYHGILDPDISAMWRQYQYAFWLAESHGYGLKIYNHMAKGRDDNRYFTSPSRGEDLLSFGTIADGWFGDYLYRHAELDAYRADVENDGPGLMGGMRRTAKEMKITRLEQEIRSGRPDPLPFIEVLGPEKAMHLFQNWIARGYLRVSADGDAAELLPNGSWFIMKMITDAVKLMDRYSS